MKMEYSQKLGIGNVDLRVRARRHISNVKSGLVSGVCGILFALTVPAASSQEISAAEKLLFQSKHLENVANPRKLRYTYVHQEAAGKDFTDEVVIDIMKKNPDGTASAASQFLSGDRNFPIEKLAEAEGNPAVLGFLERDIREMKRLTGGQPNYFRKRIRLALAESAKVDPVSISYKGRDVKAQKIVIQPYLNDPMQHKFSQYVDKRYVFILSDQIPGSLYQIQTSIPSKPQAVEKSEATLIEETMTLAS